MDYYEVAPAMVRGDKEDAEDYLFNRMWETNIFGLDKDWVTTIIRRGKEKLEKAWEMENQRVEDKVSKSKKG